MSMQRVINNRTLLRTYALKRTIESLGHLVEFFDLEQNLKDYLRKALKICYDLPFLIYIYMALLEKYYEIKFKKAN